MSGLAEFVRARLDEDEAAAKACHYADWQAGSDADVVPVHPEGNSYVAVGPWGSGMEDADVRHIARHDPARVLREVEAGRKLIEEFSARSSQDVAEIYLATLAAVYSDHPDYDPGWKISTSTDTSE